MWDDPASDPRGPATSVEGERATLLDYLRAYRTTLEMKCEGLNAEQMARRSVAPSTMSLLGLVRHLANVERHWFRRVVSGEADVPQRFDGGRNASWDGARPDPAVVTEAWSAWREEVAFANGVIDSAGDLGARSTMPDGDTVSLREVLVHMIEEYARHCGHADLLRERIDGRVGQ
ncbi:MAG: DinB family protein [Acidimicrobiales bacterium]